MADASANNPVGVVGDSAQLGGQAKELNPFVGGSGGLNGGSGGGATPVGAVTASNPLTGVKRPALNNPTGVPNQLPGFRGRVIDSDGPIKVPKLRNGNLNNETSNIRIPYNRVTPLEFLSSFTGRLSPGDVIFVHKYAPGFLSSRPLAINGTLGVNTMSRVVGLDGLNRLLMGSNPEGWKVGVNVMHLNEDPLNPLKPSDVTNGSNTAEFGLTVLDEYRLDGVVISNDEPGAFSSSGSRDNCLFNVAIQGPTPINNGFLLYEDEDGGSDMPRYNPLTGVTNMRTVESHARGSAESGQHLTEATSRPGRVGSPWLGNGKVDFVANFCGTYSQYPSQMFDRRVEILNTLYLGLRAFEMSTEAKMQVVDENGYKKFAREEEARDACMVFFQYMPFSSRASEVIHQVTREHMARANMANETAFFNMEVTDRNKYAAERASAAKNVSAALFRRSAQNDVNAPFDNRAYDAIRTVDLQNMVGAWHLGRVLDTKAARHDPYAGGPRDTSFSCMIDVGLSWRSALPYNQMFPDGLPDDRTPYWGATPDMKIGQRRQETLTNAAQPCLRSVLGPEFGRHATKDAYCTYDKQRKDTGDPNSFRTEALRRDAEEAARIRAVRLQKEEELKTKLAAAPKLAAGTYVAGDEKDEAYTEIMKGLSTLQMTLLLNVRDTYKDYPEPVSKAQHETLKGKTSAAMQKYVEIVLTKPPNTANVQASKKALKKAKSDFLFAFRQEVEYLMGGYSGDEYFEKLREFVRVQFCAISSPSGPVQTTYEGVQKEYKDILEADEPFAQQVENRFVEDNLMVLALDSIVTSNDMEAIDQDDCAVSAVFESDILEAHPQSAEALHTFRMYAIRASANSHLPIHLQLAPAKPAAKAKAPAPTGAAAAPRARSKTPPKSRAPPPGAQGVSSTPLVPTAAVAPTVAAASVAAASSTAPRRRAREGGESSTTNSVFDSMFASSPTAAAPEEPASPTPSSGSDVSASGPRTFKRIQR